MFRFFFKVDDYLGEHPDVTTLTAMFFFLNFLAATQDIAVDGWALTMLQVQLLLSNSFQFFNRDKMWVMHPPATLWDRLLDISWAMFSLWPSNPMAL